MAGPAGGVCDDGQDVQSGAGQRRRLEEVGGDARRVPGTSPGVAVTVTNTGDRDSREIVQVYFEPDEPDQPVRLVGWHAVRAAAGRTVSAEVHTDPRLWRRWDTTAGRWGALTGSGSLHVARGLGNICFTLKLDVG